MYLETQMYLRNNPEYIPYLRSNSWWYKELTRDPSKIRDLERSYKQYRRDEKAQNFTKTLEYIEFMQSLVNNML